MVEKTDIYKTIYEWLYSKLGSTILANGVTYTYYVSPQNNQNEPHIYPQIQINSGSSEPKSGRRYSISVALSIATPNRSVSNMLKTDAAARSKINDLVNRVNSTEDFENSDGHTCTILSAMMTDSDTRYINVGNTKFVVSDLIFQVDIFMNDYFVSAPTNLDAVVSGQDAELTWDYNDSNVGGFYVEQSQDLKTWNVVKKPLRYTKQAVIDGGAGKYYRVKAFYDVNSIRFISEATEENGAISEVVINYSAYNNGGIYKAFRDGRGLMLEIVPLAGIDPIDIEIVADNVNDRDKLTIQGTTSPFQISDANANNITLTGGAGNYQLAIKIKDSATGQPAFDRIRGVDLRWIGAFGDFPAAFFAFSNLEFFQLTQIKGAGGAGFNQFPSQISRLQNLKSFRQFRAFDASAAARIAPAILGISGLEELEWGETELGANANANGLAAANLDLLPNSLPNLIELRLLATALNVLPDLSGLPLELLQIALGDSIPDDELSNLNPLISNLQIQNVVGDVSSIDVGNYTQLFVLSFQNSNDISADALPTNLVDANFSTLDYRNCFNSIARANMFIDTLYDYAVANGSITGVGNFNGFTLDFRNNSNPSGVLQPPMGYENHVSNGTPASPQEKIFVLINNYHITILT